MYNTYFSSTIYGVSCKESFPLSFNGYSNLWYDRTSSQCSSCRGCCDCCALSTYRAPVNSCLLNGLRQSTLLQLSASRRLIIRGEDLYFSRVPYGLVRSCYELKCPNNQRNVSSSNKRRVKEICFCSASQKGRENFPSSASDDSEVVLSFLSEEADKDATNIKLKNVSSSKRKEAEKKRNNVSRERRFNLSDEKIKTKQKGNLKQHEASSSINLRRQSKKHDTEREAYTKGENRKKQRDMSSCSSYYTLSSGDFESDIEVQHKTDLDKFSLGYEKNEENRMEGRVKEEFDRQRDDLKKVRDGSNEERIEFGEDIDWNIRKKSEKKLTEETVQETKSTRESTIHESGYGKASISQKQVHSEEDNSSFVEHLDKKTNKAYIQSGTRRKYQSAYTQESGCDETETTLLSAKKISGRKENLKISETTLAKETSDKNEKFVASTSTTRKESLKSKKAFSGKEGKLDISETLLQETNEKHKKFIDSTSTTTNDVIETSSHKYIGNSKIEDTVRTSDTRMMKMGEKKNSVLSSSQEVELQHHKGEKIIAHDKDIRRKSQQYSEVSKAHESHVEDISIVKSKTSVKNKEERSYLSSHATDTSLQTDRRRTQSVQHSKGYEHIRSSSEGYASDEKQVSSSQITSEKMRFIPKSKFTSAVKTRESSSQTEERIFEFSNDRQRTMNLSISDETLSKEKFSFQGSLNSVSEAGIQVTLPEGYERSSEIISIPSSSQMGRVSAHVEHAAGIASSDIYLETSESSSSALYDNSGTSPAMLSGPHSQYGSDKSYSEPSIIITPEDVLGSAILLEESSRKFVDEFAESVRHEVTTSERQEMEVARRKLAVDVEDNQMYSSRQQGTQNDSQSKNRDSSHSAGFHGAKGISDEMWDVKEPSAKPDINNETAKPIVTRTGRSLWSTISDIVRLRWNSRAASSTSGGRSGDRNSPNKSDSETWFSGQEHEEIVKNNVIKETNVLPQDMTSDKSKSGTRFTQSDGEVSDSKILKDKGKHIEVGSSSPNMTSDKSKSGTRYTQSDGEVSDTKMLKDKGKHIEVGSSSLNKLESGSTSIDASYAARAEFSSQTKNAEDLKVTTSGLKIESPITLPVSGQPIAGDIVNIGASDMSRTESVVPVKESIAPVMPEMSSSERKDGELKQRKFQRKGQVLRDRFDDWEEAYKVELEQRRIDEMFMKEALLEAKKAADTWEVPVGAVLVQHGKIIARGCNLVEELRDSTAHAEMICIREASKLLHSWRLSETTLYVTLEPCTMCAGAIFQARVDTVVWGAPNKQLGADGSWIRLFPDGEENASQTSDLPPAPVHPFHPKIKIRRGVLSTECAEVLQEFFQLRRRKKKEEPSKDPSCLPITHHHPTKLLNKIQDIFHVMFCL